MADEDRIAAGLEKLVSTPTEQRYKETFEKSGPGDEDLESLKEPGFLKRNEDWLAKALMPVAGAAIGSLFDGYRGGATGAKAGIVGLEKLESLEKADEEKKKELRELISGQEEFLVDQETKNRAAVLRALEGQIRTIENQRACTESDCRKKLLYKS